MPDGAKDKRCPCYKCEDRHTGCHTACEKYKGYKERANEVREKRLKESQGTISPRAFIDNGFRYQVGKGWVPRSDKHRNRNRT